MRRNSATVRALTRNMDTFAVWFVGFEEGFPPWEEARTGRDRLDRCLRPDARRCHSQKSKLTGLSIAYSANVAYITLTGHGSHHQQHTRDLAKSRHDPVAYSGLYSTLRPHTIVQVHSARHVHRQQESTL